MKKNEQHLRNFRDNRELGNFFKKIVGQITSINPDGLEVWIKTKHKQGFCRTVDITDFKKDDLDSFFKVGDMHHFYFNPYLNEEVITLNYKFLHPEEIKVKLRQYNTISYNKNLYKYFQSRMKGFKFKKY